VSKLRGGTKTTLGTMAAGAVSTTRRSASASDYLTSSIRASSIVRLLSMPSFFPSRLIVIILLLVHLHLPAFFFCFSSLEQRLSDHITNPTRPDKGKEQRERTIRRRERATEREPIIRAHSENISTPHHPLTIDRVLFLKVSKSAYKLKGDDGVIDSL
jgi:hypothetical protein